MADVSFEDDGTARLLVRDKTDRAGCDEVLFLDQRTTALAHQSTARRRLTCTVASRPIVQRIQRIDEAGHACTDHGGSRSPAFNQGKNQLLNLSQASSVRIGLTMNTNKPNQTGKPSSNHRPTPKTPPMLAAVRR